VVAKRCGFIGLYYDFCKYLNENRERIAPMMLSGRIEDYLVKEFAYYVYTSTDGRLFVFVNLGKRGERRVDICIMDKDKMDSLYICGMAEAKYIHNNHRISIDSATDEIFTSLKNLGEQIGRYTRETHGGYKVNLKSTKNYIYGMVFVGYVCRANDEASTNKKRKFFKSVLQKARKCEMKYHDLNSLSMVTIFEDVPVHFIDSDYYVTLKSGLWRREQEIKNSVNP